MIRPDGLTRDVGALVLRLVACLLLTGGVLFGVLAVAFSRLDERVVAGAARYALPGSRATLDPAIVPVLGGCGGAMALFGLAALLLGRRRRATPVWPGASVDLPRSDDQRSGVDRTSGQPASRRPHRLRPILILLGGMLLLAAVLAWRWSRSTDSGIPVSVRSGRLSPSVRPRTDCALPFGVPARGGVKWPELHRCTHAQVTVWA